jgi:hypothetical protein
MTETYETRLQVCSQPRTVMASCSGNMISLPGKSSANPSWLHRLSQTPSSHFQAKKHRRKNQIITLSIWLPSVSAAESASKSSSKDLLGLKTGAFPGVKALVTSRIKSLLRAAAAAHAKVTAVRSAKVPVCSWLVKDCDMVCGVLCVNGKAHLLWHLYRHAETRHPGTSRSCCGRPEFLTCENFHLRTRLLVAVKLRQIKARHTWNCWAPQQQSIFEVLQNLIILKGKMQRSAPFWWRQFEEGTWNLMATWHANGCPNGPCAKYCHVRGSRNLEPFAAKRRQLTPQKHSPRHTVHMGPPKYGGTHMTPNYSCSCVLWLFMLPSVFPLVSCPGQKNWHNTSDWNAEYSRWNGEPGEEADSWNRYA